MIYFFISINQVLLFFVLLFRFFTGLFFGFFLFDFIQDYGFACILLIITEVNLLLGNCFRFDFLFFFNNSLDY